MREIKKTDEHLVLLIKELRKKSSQDKVGLWSAIAKNLSLPSRIRPEVNLFKINKYVKDGDIVVVPGKVLATGSIDHKITVAAYNFSKAAREKIMQKGVCMTIDELMKENIKGKNIRILK